MEQDTIEFLAALEEKLGEKPTWRTFSTWYGSTDGTLREYGVFLCKAGGRLYLEDFERNPSILGIQIKQKNKEKYVQYSRFIKISDIKEVRRVKKKDASMMVKSRVARALEGAGPLAKAFSSLVTQVELESGECVYFELINPKEFLKIIGR